MTRDGIDDLMRDNGIVVVGEAVYALCQIVAAREREACAKVAEQWPYEDERMFSIAQAIRSRVDQ